MQVTLIWQNFVLNEINHTRLQHPAGIMLLTSQRADIVGRHICGVCSKNAAEFAPEPMIIVPNVKMPLRFLAHTRAHTQHTWWAQSDATQEESHHPVKQTLQWNFISCSRVSYTCNTSGGAGGVAKICCCHCQPNDKAQFSILLHSSPCSWACSRISPQYFVPLADAVVPKKSFSMNETTRTVDAIGARGLWMRI